MLSYNLNTTRNSYVREQAYFPSIAPLRGWVCNAGSKGLFESLSSNSVYDFLRCGYFLAVFFACLKYPGEYSIFRFIKYCLYCVFYSFKQYACFLFGLKRPFFKRLMLLLSFKKITHIIPDCLNLFGRKAEQHLINVGYGCIFHAQMIKNKQRPVNIEKMEGKRHE